MTTETQPAARLTDLDELERLEREATPGPWESSPYAEKRPAFSLHPIHISRETYDVQWRRKMKEGVDTFGIDTEFVAALRNSAPALLAEVRELRAVVAENEWVVATERKPESGLSVLVSNGTNVARARWIPAKTETGEYHGEQDYDEAADEYYWPEGWYEWNTHEETHWKIDGVTHWKPLPEPAPALASITPNPKEPAHV